MKKIYSLLFICLSFLCFSQNRKAIKPPIFPNCENYEGKPEDCFEKEFKLHLNKNFEYPKVAIDSVYQGRVILHFVINELGVVENISAKGPYPSLEAAAIKIAKALPKMKPAQNKRRKPVSVPFSIPIVYSLQ